MKVVTYTLRQLFHDDDHAKEMVAQTVQFSEILRSKIMKKLFLSSIFCLTALSFDIFWLRHSSGLVSGGIDSMDESICFHFGIKPS
jgi:hypothetical protein